jgi:TorA maturation chaperone TorD
MKRDNAVPWASQLAAFQLLSIGLTCPDKDIVEGMRDGSIYSDVFETLVSLGFSNQDDYGIHLSEELKSAAAGQNLLSSLRKEYTRLFTDPSKPAIDIYETLFLDPDRVANDFGPILVRSPEAIDARYRYEAAGAKMAIQDSPDNMRVECEFAGYLCYQLDVAVRNSEKTDSWLEHLEEFKKTHLRRWFSDFFNKLKTGAGHPYYQLIGLLGCKVVDAGLV